jgi:hypothetical protein
MSLMACGGMRRNSRRTSADTLAVLLRASKWLPSSAIEKSGK